MDQEIRTHSRQRVAFISLGCPKNLVDTEHMLGILQHKGFSLVPLPEEADVAVINTCGFLESAVREAIDTILETARLKKEKGLQKLVVVGCMVQRYGRKLSRELPEVDAWLGTSDYHRIAEMLVLDNPHSPPFFIGRPTSLPDHLSPRIRATPFYTAYLRIAEGCSHGCTFCLIPKIRGPYRSRSLASLLMEAEQMVSEGVKEIVLIAQDTSIYGKDLSPPVSIEDLLEGLLRIPALKWIRLLYFHPDRVTDRLLELMASEEALCPYLDIPFQHVAPPILEAMGRPMTGESPQELVRRIRRCKRPLSIRTTLMVGFPGETHRMFQELHEFVEMARFERLGTFLYSPEAGTRAARLAPGVSSRTAAKRRERIMMLQSGISREIHEQSIGRVLPVLLEGASPETDLLLCGRTMTMAPDVDGRVLINQGEGIVGDILPVRITEAHPYDLVGEILSRTSRKRTEVRSQRSEVRGQRSGGRRQESEEKMNFDTQGVGRQAGIPHV